MWIAPALGILAVLTIGATVTKGPLAGVVVGLGVLAFITIGAHAPLESRRRFREKLAEAKAEVQELHRYRRALEAVATRNRTTVEALLGE